MGMFTRWSSVNATGEHCIEVSARKERDRHKVEDLKWVEDLVDAILEGCTRSGMAGFRSSIHVSGLSFPF